MKPHAYTLQEFIQNVSAVAHSDEEVVVTVVDLLCTGHVRLGGKKVVLHPPLGAFLHWARTKAARPAAPVVLAA
jgi:hypothetical protein